MNRYTTCCSLAALTCLLLITVCSVEGRIRTVALEGQPVPRAASGTVYGQPDYPLLNAAGQAAFWGGFITESGEGFEAIYREVSKGGATVIARSGSEVESLPGVWIDDTTDIRSSPVFKELKLNSSGKVAFGARLRPTAEADESVANLRFLRSVWSEGGDDGLRLVAWTGSQINGQPAGVRFTDSGLADFSQNSTFSSINLDNYGRVSFLGHRELPADPNRQPFEIGLWREEVGVGMVQLVRSNPRQYGVPADTATDPLGIDGPIQGFGKVVASPDGSFTIRDGYDTDGLSAPGDLHRVLRYSEGEGLSEVVRDGDRSNEMSEDYFFFDVRSNYRDIAVAPRTGTSAFVGSMSHTPVPITPSVDQNQANSYGIWAEQPNGQLRLIALDGQPASGTSDETFYTKGYVSPEFSSLSVNDAGQVAFVSSLSSGQIPELSDQGGGIWSEGGGNGLELVVRSGDLAPGFNRAIFFTQVAGDRFAPRSTAIINAGGQVAFSGQISSRTGNSPDAYDGQSIWVQDPDDGLALIVKSGDQIDVSGDPLIEDYRTIRLLRDSNRISSLEPPSFQFNDRGEVAFWAQFTDGTSGIFVSSLVAVPEPTTAVLLILGLATMSRRRR